MTCCQTLTIVIATYGTLEVISLGFKLRAWWRGRKARKAARAEELTDAEIEALKLTLTGKKETKNAE